MNRQDTPESELRGDEKCAVPCELGALGTNGEQQLTGPCGCIGPEGNCNEEFNQVIVRDLCSRMGSNPVAGSAQVDTPLPTSEQSKPQGKQRLFQLRAGAE